MHSKPAGEGAEWVKESEKHLFVYGNDTNQKIDGRLLIKMGGVQIAGGSNKKIFDSSVKTEEVAIQLITRAANSTNAYVWDFSAKRLYEQAPYTKSNGTSAGEFKLGEHHILFMFANEFIGEGTNKLVGTTLSILAGVSIIISF